MRLCIPPALLVPNPIAPFPTPPRPSWPRRNAELCAKWFLEERPVPVKGRGVFPTQPIPAGELIIKFEGPVYDKATMAEEKDFSEAIQVRGGGRVGRGAAPCAAAAAAAAAPRPSLPAALTSFLHPPAILVTQRWA